MFGRRSKAERQPRLPGAIRVVLVGLVIFFIASDLINGVLTDLTAGQVLTLVGPYLPLLAVAISPRAGAITWLVSAAGLTVTAPDNLMLNAFVFPTFITVGANVFLLQRRAAIAFTTAVLLWTVTIPVFSLEATWESVDVVVILNLLAVAVGYGLRRYRRKLDRSVKRVQWLEERQALARAEERRQLSHELHDIVAHGVTIIAMQARRAEFVDDQVKIQAILRSIGETAQLTLEDLRRLVLLLQKTEQHEDVARRLDGRTPVVAGPDQEQILDRGGSGETTAAVGLSHDVHQVKHAIESAGFTVDLVEPANFENIPTSLRQALRRTVNELGTNILKHADPNYPVAITIESSTNQVALCTENRAASAPPIVSSGTGLTAIKERAHAMDGYFESGLEADGLWRSRFTMSLVSRTNGHGTLAHGGSSGPWRIGGFDDE